MKKNPLFTKVEMIGHIVTCAGSILGLIVILTVAAQIGGSLR